LFCGKGDAADTAAVGGVDIGGGCGGSVRSRVVGSSDRSGGMTKR